MRDHSVGNGRVVFLLSIASLITGVFWGTVASLAYRSVAAIPVAAGSALVAFAFLALVAGANRK